MTSGLEWREWSAPYSSRDNPVVGIWFQDKDPITYILEKPLIDEPGKSFTYSTGNMQVLGEIIKNAANMTIDEFSGKYLLCWRFWRTTHYGLPRIKRSSCFHWWQFRD